MGYALQNIFNFMHLSYTYVQKLNLVVHMCSVKRINVSLHECEDRVHTICIEKFRIYFQKSLKKKLEKHSGHVSMCLRFVYSLNARVRTQTS